ncbi:hypothetical protein D9M69_592850 [compost metagenome]
MKNSFHMTRPIMSVLAPPSISGITYSPTAGMNTSMAPAITPCRDNGTVIRQKACQGLAPRSYAASSRRRSIFTSVAYRGRMKNGR